MTDSSLDREMDLSERLSAVTEARRVFKTSRPQPSSRPRLSVEEAAARRAEAALKVKTVTAAETVPPHSVPPPDPAATLRHARLGLFAALTLALIFVWLIQRRKESVR